MKLEEEKKLIKKAQRDPKVFAKIYDEYYSKIFGFILKRTANLEIAQDITSETFFKALKNLWQFRWRNISIAAWLYRIANNEINNFYRKKNKIVQISLDKVPEIPSRSNPEREIKIAEKELENKKEFLKLHQNISKLNPVYQGIITLRFFEKKRISEISQILGRPEGTIKSQIHRALKQLKRLMES